MYEVFVDDINTVTYTVCKKFKDHAVATISKISSYSLSLEEVESKYANKFLLGIDKENLIKENRKKKKKANDVYHLAYKNIYG